MTPPVKIVSVVCLSFLAAIGVSWYYLSGPPKSKPAKEVKPEMKQSTSTNTATTELNSGNHKPGDDEKTSLLMNKSGVGEKQEEELIGVVDRD